jgi:hypothetical protein
MINSNLFLILPQTYVKLINSIPPISRKGNDSDTPNISLEVNRMN